MESDIADSIKSKLNLAMELVSDIEEPLKLEAFKFVLQNFNLSQSTKETGKTQSEDNPPETNSFFDNLTKQTKVPLEVLEDFYAFDIDSNTFALKFVPQSSSSAKEQQVQASIVYLLGKTYGLGEKIATSKELVQMLTNLGVESIKNFSTYIGSETTFFSVTGVKNSSNKKYSLTTKGLMKGIDILKNNIS